MPRPITAVCLLDAGIVAATALALLTTLEPGLRLTLGIVTLSVNSPIRPAILAIVLAALRLRRPPSSPATTATHLLLASLAAASVGYWLRYLTTVSGGADSYGYMSAARLLAHGRLITPQPDAAWLPAANAIAALSPLGYTPSLDATAIVPTYPLGYPALLALTELLVPADVAPYLVTPALGLVVLVLVYRITTTWTGGATAAWLATALVAWDPLLVTYAKQPMSDVPATAFLLAAAWCLVRMAPRPLLAGLAAGGAFMIRPGGVGAIAAVAVLALWRLRPVLRSLAWFAAGLLPLVAAQAYLQWTLFGSPWKTGYGSLGDLYAGGSTADNATIYLGALATTHVVVWAPLVLAGLWALRRTWAWWIVLLLALSLGPYLLYFRFDHWETLRFVLPAVVILDIAAAVGALALVNRVPAPRLHPIAIAALALWTFASTGTFLRREGVPTLMEQERRYTVTADWLAGHTAAETLVFAGQHSGSIRHYGARTTIRWDLLDPADIGPIVWEAHRRGRLAVAALDRDEQPVFRDRFAAAMAPSGSEHSSVHLLPLMQLRDVQIWEIAPGTASR